MTKIPADLEMAYTRRLLHAVDCACYEIDRVAYKQPTLKGYGVVIEVLINGNWLLESECYPISRPVQAVRLSDSDGRAGTPVYTGVELQNEWAKWLARVNAGLRYED